VALLVIISVVLMTLDHRQHHLEGIRAALATVVYPFRYAVSLPATFGNWASESLATRARLLERNDALQEEHLRLQARLQRFEALERENTRLRELLHSAQKVRNQVLIAELLAVDQDPFKRQVVLNKGTRDGVFEGQPLIDAHGVMGQVLHTAPFTSTAVLITDPGHALPVQVNRNGLRAVAQGTGAANRLEVPHIPNSADVRVGDLLVTSGLGQRFPPGYPVARVDAVEKDPSLPYAQVTARPTAWLERSREVLLVWQAEAEPGREDAVKNAPASGQGPKKDDEEGQGS